MMSAQRNARFGWAGIVQDRHEQERDVGKNEGPAGEAVEAIGDVHPVARRDDRERRERDVDRRIDERPARRTGTAIWSIS